jgi:hypothetical protein
MLVYDDLLLVLLLLRILLLLFFTDPRMHLGSIQVGKDQVHCLLYPLPFLLPLLLQHNLLLLLLQVDVQDMLVM